MLKPLDEGHQSDIRDPFNTAPDIAALIRATGFAHNDESTPARRPPAGRRVGGAGR
jgi:hypothetical protein